LQAGGRRCDWSYLLKIAVAETISVRSRLMAPHMAVLLFGQAFSLVGSG